MSNKYVGLGFSLKMNSTAIAGIRSISIGEAAGTAVDVTVIEDLSTSDRYMRKAGGLVDPGALNLTLAYDPADGSHKALAGALHSGVASSFTIIYPTTTITQVFNGIVNALGVELPMGELVTCSVRIDKTGLPGFSS
jgi:predicted secreted protein